MNLLARREQSFFELTQKITEKYPDLDRDEIILPALEKLREENLQSDERFAESYVRYRSSRGVGPLKIAMEMQQKGLNSGLAESALYTDGPDWYVLCMGAYNKKYPDGVPDSQADRAKCYRFLAQRGFSSEQIQAAIKPVRT